MLSQDMYIQALNQTSLIIDKITDEDLPKPVVSLEKWDVRALLSYLLTDLEAAASALQGQAYRRPDRWSSKTIVKDALKAQVAWHAIVGRACAAAQAARLDILIDTSLGEMNCEEFLALSASDYLLRSWDLARALDAPLEFDPQLAESCYVFLQPIQPYMVRMGLWALARPISQTAAFQERLLALSGRKSA